MLRIHWAPSQTDGLIHGVWGRDGVGRTLGTKTSARPRKLAGGASDPAWAGGAREGFLEGGGPKSSVSIFNFFIGFLKHKSNTLLGARGESKLQEYIYSEVKILTGVPPA